MSTKQPSWALDLFVGLQCVKLTTTPFLSSQNDAGQEIKRIRDHQKRNALLEQNLSTPFRSSPSQI